MTLNESLLDPFLGIRIYYPVSKRTVERWVAKGCPSRLIDGRRLFRPSQVEKWLIQFNQGNWLK
jgi:hypothetical protein